MVKIMSKINPKIDGDSFLQHFLPGSSESIKKLRRDIYHLNIAHKNRRMVPSILLLGERGVGKGYTAHVIAAHFQWLIWSKGTEQKPDDDSDVYALARQAGFRKLTLTAVPEDLAEANLFGADKGAYTGSVSKIIGLFECDTWTDVFLDEIGDAPAKIQAKLLEVLETRTFRRLGTSFDSKEFETEARVLSATNQNLQRLVDEGSFRADLYDRLRWASLFLPPLREQMDQLPTIIRRMNKALCAKYKLQEADVSDPDVKWCQDHYDWPGNHRELNQVLWTWHLLEREVSLRKIVEDRSVIELVNTNEDFRSKMVQLCLSHFSAIYSGDASSYESYGEIGEELRTLGYEAFYRFKEKKQLKDEDLKRMFSKVDPKNVRKQISANRPKAEER
jgi:DNA-binding NtrC family response regulator